jgi:hypothetical protein
MIFFGEMSLKTAVVGFLALPDTDGDHPLPGLRHAESKYSRPDPIPLQAWRH